MESDSDYSFPLKCSQLRVKGYAMLKGHPCQIVEINISRPGKHGHAKSHITGLDIFTRRKVEDIMPSTHMIRVPYVTKKDYPLVYLPAEGDCLALLIDDAVNTDYAMPEGELGRAIRAAFKSGEGDIVCSTLQACAEQIVTGYKVIREE